MKTLGCLVILLLCFAAPVYAAQVYSGCATLPSTFRHVWYFDPVHGKTQGTGGNGSQASPWNNLQALIQSESGYPYDGIDYAASNIAITHNSIHDNLDIGDGNHEDAMQGQAGFLGAGESGVKEVAR